MSSSLLILMREFELRRNAESTDDGNLECESRVKGAQQ